MKVFNFVCEAETRIGNSYSGRNLRCFNVRRGPETCPTRLKPRCWSCICHSTLAEVYHRSSDHRVAVALPRTTIRRGLSPTIVRYFQGSHCHSTTSLGTFLLLRAAQAEQKRPTEVSFMVVYDRNKGWHVMKEDDTEWEFERTDSDGRERRRSLQPCFGPFFSNQSIRTKAR